MSKARRVIPVIAIITGLLLVIGASGISCCDCSYWNQATVTWDGSSPETWTGNCESAMPISWINLGTAVSVSSSVVCSHGCSPVYSWSVTKTPGSGAAEGPWSGGGLPATFSPAYPGCFTVVLNAICENYASDTCPPCETTICIYDIAACTALCGCDITDMAVANDGNTVYVICGSKVYKSTDGGCNFAECISPPWAAGGVGARLIAVSPDNPNAIAIVDSTAAAGGNAAGRVWVSNNSCTTWTALPQVPGNAANTARVRDIVVGPARAAALLGRDYAVAVADDRAAAVQGGDILFIGYTAAWTSCAAGSAADNLTANQFDFTSVVFTPSFIGDRCLVAVGSDNMIGPYGGETALFIIQTSDVPPVAQVPAPYPVRMVTAATPNSPGDFGAAAGCITVSSIALPADFDPTSPPSIGIFVGWTSVNGPGVAGGWDDVYRVDFTTVRKLQSGCTSGIWSIAYSGVISGGTLIAGEAATTMVRHTDDPQLSLPTWYPASTPPTGTSCTVVGMAPSFPTTETCYAGTSGTGSCFFISTDGADTFHP